MKKKSISINAALNTIKSALSVLFPLITYPYAVRVLHVEGIGKVNYADSIVGYFSLIAALGISTYAIREGAKIREDKDRFSRFTGEVFTINVVTSLFAYFLLVLCLVLIPKLHAYSTLILILSMSIALTTIGVDWINTIYEDFLFVTIRSIFSHIITLLLLFLLVHDENDLYYYALLTVVTNGIICISNLFYCRRYARIRLVAVHNVKQHLKPMFILFANNLAISIYVNSDTTMLGWMVGDYYVGLYSAAVKIYKIIKSMLAAIYSVTIPRLSNLVGKGDYENFRKLYTDLLNCLTLLLFPAGIGLIILSKEIMLIIAGEEYIEGTSALQILGISIIFAILGGAFTSCLNIPLRREKVNMKATTISAIANVGLNLFFIPLFKHNGAAITTAISELIVLLYCFLTFPQKKKYINIKLWGTNSLHAVIGSIAILILATFLKMFIINTFLRVLIIIPFSVLTYIIVLLLFNNKYLHSGFTRIRKKISAK